MRFIGLSRIGRSLPERVEVLRNHRNHALVRQGRYHPVHQGSHGRHIKRFPRSLSLRPEVDQQSVHRPTTLASRSVRCLHHLGKRCDLPGSKRCQPDLIHDEGRFARPGGKLRFESGDEPGPGETRLNQAIVTPGIRRKLGRKGAGRGGKPAQVLVLMLPVGLILAREVFRQRLPPEVPKRSMLAVGLRRHRWRFGARSSQTRHEQKQ